MKDYNDIAKASAEKNGYNIVRPSAEHNGYRCILSLCVEVEDTAR